MEAALIGFAAKSFYDGKEEKKSADRFAEANYKVSNFTQFYDNMKSHLFKICKDAGLSDSVANARVNEYIVQELYWGNDVPYYQGNLSQGELEAMYEDNYFVQGWNDCDPSYNPLTGYDTSGIYKYNNDWYFDDTLKFKPFVSKYENGQIVKGKETIFGYSQNQSTYMDKLSRSNQLYDIGNIFIFVLLANHIASAVDALITARAYNDELLNKKSVWQHINLEQNFAMTETGVKTNIGLKVRF
jgi:hypothetical protein